MLSSEDLSIRCSFCKAEAKPNLTIEGSKTVHGDTALKLTNITFLLMI